MTTHNEIKDSAFARRADALNLLLNMKPSMTTGEMLLNFVKAIDPYAEAVVLPSDFNENEIKKSYSHLLSPRAFAAAQVAVHGKTAIFYNDENLWCFFPIYSQENYGLACIKFGVPRSYDEVDKTIFSLAGFVMGLYVENNMLYGQQPSLRLLFRAIFDNFDQPIVIVDKRGMARRINPVAKILYGYDEMEIVGKSFIELVSPADSPTQYDNFMDVIMQSDTVYNEEMTHIKKDCTIIDVSVTAFPFRSDDNIINGAVLMIRDLKEQKRLQIRMAHCEKISILGEMLYSVSNELNNSLTTIIGNSEHLAQKNIDKEIHDAVYKIHKEANICSNIIRNLTGLARGDEQKEFLHVNEVVSAVLSLKQYHLISSNINVIINLGEDIPRTMVGSYSIKSLFLRIINYAEQRMIEYSSGGKLTVETAFENGNIIVRFADTGTFIRESDAVESIDPFSIWSKKLDDGLDSDASCYILRYNCGRILIDSQFGKENIIRVELPVEPPAERETQYEVTELRQENIQITGASKKILIVDDNPAIVDLIIQIVRQMGYSADGAEDGNEAMKKLDNEDYALIISDLKMPGGFTGDRVYKFIKRRNPDLAERIIFMTGDVVNSETQKFLKDTGNPYLEKPFLLEDLKRIIRNLNLTMLN